MRRYALVALFASVILVAAQSHAALRCYSGFETNAGVLLHGVNDGTGFIGGWQVEGNTSALGYVIADVNPLEYGILQIKGNYAQGGHAYQTSGRSFDSLNAFGPWATNYAGIWSIGRYDSPPLWMSYLIRPLNATYTSKVGLDNTAAVFHDNAGIMRVQRTSSSGNKWVLSVMNNWLISTSAVEIVANATSFMVVKVQFGDPHTVDLYVNPAIGGAAPTTPDATLTFSTNGFYFREITWNPNNSAAQGWLDEVRLGDTFGDVAPVPEPAGVILLALSAAAVAARRSVGLGR
ncbi:hypothetical protein GX586_09280 [bacterium]|nr:hypothetical protein [bacterium]